jgi:hypothetical protein
LGVARQAGGDLADDQLAVGFGGVENAVAHWAAGRDVKQLGELFGIVAEDQDLIALDRVVDAP